MSEQKLQAKILKWLDKQGFYTIKVIVCNKKGVTDIIACSPEGLFVGIEVKWGNNKPSKLQEYHVSEIKKRNGFAMVCWSLEELIKELKEVGICSI